MLRLKKLLEVVWEAIQMEQANSPEPCPFCGGRVKEKQTYWEIAHKGDCYLAERIGCHRTILDKSFKDKLKQWNKRPTEKAAYVLGRKEQAVRGKQRID